MKRLNLIRPPFPQNPSDVIRADTCDTRRLKNPLAGIMSTHRNALGYRYSSPRGDGVLFRITRNPSGLPLLSVHCSLLTGLTPIRPAVDGVPGGSTPVYKHRFGMMKKAIKKR